MTRADALTQLRETMAAYMCFLETGVPWLSADEMRRPEMLACTEWRFPSSEQMAVAVEARKLWLYLLQIYPDAVRELWRLEKAQQDLLCRALLWRAGYLETGTHHLALNDIAGKSLRDLEQLGARVSSTEQVQVAATLRSMRETLLRACWGEDDE